MYIYFNDEGILTTQINHGEVARQGSTLHLYIAFSKDYDLSNKILDIRFKKPGEIYFNSTNYFPDSQVPELKVFEKVKNNEITYDLVDGEIYQVYTWTADSTVGLTDEYGTANVVVRLLEDTSADNSVVENIITKGLIQIYVEKTFGEKKNKITINQTEYNYLVNIVGQSNKRIEKLELHFINDLSELDSYTTSGIYKFNLNNQGVFHLYVNEYTSNGVKYIRQIRSSATGYYARTNIDSVWNEWEDKKQYNINGITEWNESVSYKKGAIVSYFDNLFVCREPNKNIIPYTDERYWNHITFDSYVVREDLNNYVPKEEGKGLSSNDYTNEEKNKLAGLENYDDTELKNELNKKVYKDDLKTINGESIIGSGDIEVKGADVDLSNYYDIPTANALLSAKEDKANLKALAYKDSLNKTDVGLGNVNNTSDTNKPISNATQVALDNKVDKTTLNDYYTIEETDEKIADVVEIAEGKTNSYVVNKVQANNKLDSQEDSITLLLEDFPLNTTSGTQVFYTNLKVGDIIYITNTDVPDRWVGMIQSNFIVLYKMETSKVNLNDKLTIDTETHNQAARIYGVSPEGEQQMFSASFGATENTIAYRQSGGRLDVGTPTTNSHATNKQYVDELVESESINVTAKIKNTLLTDVVTAFSNEPSNSNNMSTFTSVITNTMSTYGSMYVSPIAEMINTYSSSFASAFANTIYNNSSTFLDSFQYVISGNPSYFAPAFAMAIEYNASNFIYPFNTVLSTYPSMFSPAYAAAISANPSYFSYPIANSIEYDPSAFASAIAAVISMNSSTFTNPIYTAIESVLNKNIDNKIASTISNALGADY